MGYSTLNGRTSFSPCAVISRVPVSVPFNERESDVEVTRTRSRDGLAAMVAKTQQVTYPEVRSRFFEYDSVRYADLK